MEHVFTVDLRGVELLGAPADAAAMMLFISNASFHRASHEGNPHTAVLFVTEDELRRGVYRGQLPTRSMNRWSRRFSLIAVDVPGDVFDVPELDLPVNDPLVLLYHAIAAAPARLGGCPIEASDEQVGEGWEDSSPTLPWGEDQTGEPAAAPVQRSTGTLPYHARYEASNGHGHVHDPRQTRAYQALGFAHKPRVTDSSRTVIYEPERHSSARPAARSGRAKVMLGNAPARVHAASRRPAPRPRSSGLFLMQFQRRFADINLGQHGVMYVSGQSAYCQAH